MPDNDKARVGQAVARVAQGDRAGARAALAEVRNAPADDYGLALALAGDTARAVEVLEPAARGMRGTSRTRQNLALAYALDGQWAKARTVAAQDVSRSEEHTSELQSLMRISYAVFCLKKKKTR